MTDHASAAHRLAGIEIRPITDDEFEPLGHAIVNAFGDDLDDGWVARFRKVMPIERTLAAFDDGDMVGTFGEFPLRLTVPGGAQIDMAGTTIVTVRSTHRRRGLLRAMMHQHLATIAERGDMVAGLWASEAPIYGRFGYGLATQSFAVTIDARRVTLPPVDAGLRVEPIAPDDLAEVVGPVWNASAPARPGFLERSDERWENIAADPESHRGGATARRHIVVKRGPDVVGYVTFRQRSVWDGPVANGSVEVDTMISTDTEAHIALWTHLLSIDLFPNVSFWNMPIDDPLIVLASDMRQVKRTMNDAGYLRILDLPRALAARSYESDGSLTIKVTDDLGYADGTFQVTVRGGTANVEASTDPSDCTMAIETLGALYLGGANAAQLATTAKLSGSAEAVSTLDRLFRTTTAPWMSEEF